MLSMKDQELLIKAPRWVVGYSLTVLFVLFMMDFALRTVVGPMTPALKSGLGLSDAEVGWLMSVVLIGVAVFSLPISVVIDRWRRSKMVSIIAVVWSAASVFSGFSTNFAQLFATRAVVGIGEAGFVSGGMALIAGMVAKERRAFITGIWTAAMPLGGAVGFLVGGRASWQAAFWAIGMMGIAFGAMAWFIPDYKAPLRPDSGRSDMSLMALKEMIRIKTLPILYLSLSLSLCFQQGTIPWAPVLLNRVMGMDNALASTVSSVLAMLAVVSMPFGGWVADRASRNNPRNKVVVVVAGVWLSTLFSAAGAYLANLPLACIGGFFVGFGVSAQLNAVQEVVPAYRRATAVGLYMFVGFCLGGMWGPIVMGGVSKVAGIQMAYIVLSAIGMVSPVGLLWACRFFNADYQHAREIDRRISEKLEQAA